MNHGIAAEPFGSRGASVMAFDGGDGQRRIEREHGPFDRRAAAVDGSQRDGGAQGLAVQQVQIGVHMQDFQSRSGLRGLDSLRQGFAHVERPLPPGFSGVRQFGMLLPSGPEAGRAQHGQRRHQRWSGRGIDRQPLQGRAERGEAEASKSRRRHGLGLDAAGVGGGQCDGEQAEENDAAKAFQIGRQIEVAPHGRMIRFDQGLEERGVEARQSEPQRAIERPGPPSQAQRASQRRYVLREQRARPHGQRGQKQGGRQRPEGIEPQRRADVICVATPIDGYGGMNGEGQRQRQRQSSEQRRLAGQGKGQGRKRLGPQQAPHARPAAFGGGADAFEQRQAGHRPGHAIADVGSSQAEHIARAGAVEPGRHERNDGGE
ncbi:MAG: hypothetical protein BWZ10_02536 [candidate division BRC1 bacterium ADurb.BinA364]|nr:MAG: hypothetical protein BWZ10_02536 [candidate division BRC1 bacterium ADurb.BinA364]